MSVSTPPRHGNGRTPPPGQPPRGVPQSPGGPRGGNGGRGVPGRPVGPGTGSPPVHMPPPVPSNGRGGGPGGPGGPGGGGPSGPPPSVPRQPTPPRPPMSARRRTRGSSLGPMPVSNVVVLEVAFAIGLVLLAINEKLIYVSIGITFVGLV